MNNLRKVADQQKNQRAEKMKNRILKQTQDKKLAESLSPIYDKLEEVNKSTNEIGDIVKESKPEIPQPAIENTQPQIPIENNQDDTQPGVLYDASLENTLTNMKNEQKGFFKIRRTKTGKDIGMEYLFKHHVIRLLK